ncbi:MAG: hydroxyethylthiazole kinase [Lachnospiraceae bacterium]
MEQILENIKKLNPIVHCITNFVTVNDCANIILACGASPTMASHPEEVEDITACSNSLVLNMGTVSDVEAMILAAKKSNQVSHPVVFDPVGVGASQLRKDVFARISSEAHLDVVRGNVSEIKQIATGYSQSKGVDAGAGDQISEHNVKEIAQMAVNLSKKMQNIIVISGPIDIITDGITTYLVRNGHEMMPKITGSGCMSTALIGAFCAGNPDDLLMASLMAVVTMGISGEKAYGKTIQNQGGTMTFRMHMMDEVSLMTWDKLQGGMCIEKL